YRSDSGGRPGSAFGLLAFRPGRDFAIQDDLVFYDAHVDPIRVHFRSPPQSLLDTGFDLRRQDIWLFESDQVDDAPDPGQVTHRFFSGCLLILVVNFAIQSNPPALYLNLNDLGRDPNVPFQRVDGSPGDVFVIADMQSWHINF